MDSVLRQLARDKGLPTEQENKNWDQQAANENPIEDQQAQEVEQIRPRNQRHI